MFSLSIFFLLLAAVNRGVQISLLLVLEAPAQPQRHWHVSRVQGPDGHGARFPGGTRLGSGGRLSPEVNVPEFQTSHWTLPSELAEPRGFRPGICSLFITAAAVKPALQRHRRKESRAVRSAIHEGVSGLWRSPVSLKIHDTLCCP